jgi:hypothetical protein
MNVRAGKPAQPVRRRPGATLGNGVIAGAAQPSLSKPIQAAPMERIS